MLEQKLDETIEQLKTGGEAINIIKMVKIPGDIILALEQDLKLGKSLQFSRYLSQVQALTAVATPIHLTYLGRFFNSDETDFSSVQQASALAHIMESQDDLLAVLPTGGGKSLLFFVPAMVEGTGPRRLVSIVVVPLVSLTQDMLRRAREHDIRCDTWQGIDRTSKGVQLLFVAAEHCKDTELITYLGVLFHEKRLARFYVDEAHLTLTQLSFRNSMHDVHLLRRWPVPMILLSATVPPSMESQLGSHFSLWLFTVIRAPTTARPSLEYSIVTTTTPLESIVDRLVQRDLVGKPGIIFCRSKADAESVATKLEEKLKVPCVPYHAQLHPIDRQRKQQQFMEDNPVTIVCATSAFGAGIDKPNVYFVYHFEAPYSLLDYAQESGRAARGKETTGDCCNSLVCYL